MDDGRLKAEVKLAVRLSRRMSLITGDGMEAGSMHTMA